MFLPSVLFLIQRTQVTGGGSGTPGPLVAFPGAYTGHEEGILIGEYWFSKNGLLADR